MTAVLLLGLAGLLWYNKGLAFSPGQITAKSNEGIKLKGYQSHAEFEKECSICHEPLTTDLGMKCLECHEEVNQQINAGEGIHNQIGQVESCATCHPDHRGRDFDPTKAAFLMFNHATTGFRLDYHQINFDASPMECAECHQNNSNKSVDNQTCLTCHASQDKKFSANHTRNFGSDCLGCHDGADRMIGFEHASVGYALDGKHEQIKCTECHTGESLSDTPTACQECHSEPAEHQGVFEQSCETCHTPAGWLPVNLDGQSFTHRDTAGFSLALHQKDYAGQVITCKTCHPTDLRSFELNICIECHTQHDPVFMNDHQQQFSGTCLECHDGVDRLSNFDHNTFFALDGKHESAQCEECHAGKIYRGTPAECYQCHEEPEIHIGVFGQRCEYCHTSEAWSPAMLQKHPFPINHGLEDSSLQLQCDTCHGATYYEYTCYNCHDHQQDEVAQKHTAAGIAEQDIPRCAECHPLGTIIENPTLP